MTPYQCTLLSCFARCLPAPVVFAVLAPLLAMAPVAAQSFLPPEPHSAVYRDFTLAAEVAVEIFEDVTLAGHVHSNGSLELATGGSIAGDAGAHLFLAIDGTVTGSATEGAALAALPIPYDEVAGRALADRVFETSIAFAGDEAVDDVVFVVGNARFAGALTGAGTVIATGDIVLERLPAGAPSSSSRLALVALGGVVLEKGRAFRGVVVARGDVELEEEVHFTGVAVSHGRLSVDETAAVEFEGLE